MISKLNHIRVLALPLDIIKEPKERPEPECCCQKKKQILRPLKLGISNPRSEQLRTARVAVLVTARLERKDD